MLYWIFARGSLRLVFKICFDTAGSQLALGTDASIEVRHGGDFIRYGVKFE